MKNRSFKTGFTLIEVVIATALVAIMALVVVPPVIKRIDDGRAQATRTELDRIRTALREYYQDVGAFPTEDTGLTALIKDPGTAGWQGPYLTWGNDDPASAINNDQFGEQYSYDLSPASNPKKAADLIVASNGANRRNDLLVSSVWSLKEISRCDDMIILLVASGLDREKRGETVAELEALTDAARVYYRQTGGFPSKISQLTAGYIHPGINRSSLVDGWGGDYMLHLDTDQPPVLHLWSAGPNQSDDHETGDDLSWSVSSQSLEAEKLTESSGEEATPEDGSYSEYLVTEAQAALDANPTLKLKKKELKHYLAKLGLSEIFEHDDWGKKIEVNTSTRQVFSCGPDGRSDKADDNIPPGIGPYTKIEEIVPPVIRPGPPRGRPWGRRGK